MHTPENAGSYVGRSGTDANTVGLLITATEYAVAAVQRIIQQSTGSPEALKSLLEGYVDLVFGLEVNFVFPNLRSHERDLLVSLMKVRNALGVQMSGLPQWRTAAQKADHDRLTAELKSRFATLCREIRESGLEDRLDSVQHSVLKEEFLSILLDKEDNTKLFFRKRPSEADRIDQSSPDESQVFRRAAPSVDCLPTPVARDRKKILVIDRGENESRRIAQWLTLSGYEAVAGVPGFECCRQVMREKPDLILLELTGASCDWPCDTVLDGETTFKVLTRIPKARGMPVLGMAGQDTPAVRGEALQAGALTVLGKPLNRETLLQAVRGALEKFETTPQAVPAMPVLA